MAINLTGNMLNAGSLFNLNNQKQDSIAKLWSVYGSYQSNAQESLDGLTEVNTNLKAVLASYEEAKSAFNTELDETMEGLKASAEKVKSYDFSVDKEGAITSVTNTDKDGNVTTETKYNEKLRAALDTVKDLVSDYNSAIKFFSENSSVSKRVERMATTFGDTTYRAANYAAIGLTVNKDGTLNINESKLADAILNDSGKVSSTLGADGLAGKAEDHISFANSQREQLFPTAKKMLGDQLDAAALYTGKAYNNVTAYNNMGNLLNMMF